MVQAELMGDEEQEKALRQELEEARAAVAAYLSAVDDNKGIPLDGKAHNGFSGTVLCDPRYPRILDPCPPIPTDSRRDNHPYFPRSFRNSVITGEYRFPECVTHTALHPSWLS